MTLQEKLRAARTQKGLLQSDLADRIGVSQGHLSRVEKGIARIDIPFLKRICQELDLDPSDVIGLPLKAEQATSSEVVEKAA
jgi:transcriptional regulator with XRE-family HTH domain